MVYHLCDPNVDYVQIGQMNGQLTVNYLFDREISGEYETKICVHDQGSPRQNSSAGLTLKILDLNDNAPDILDRVELYIYENHTACKSCLIYFKFCINYKLCCFLNNLYKIFLK